MQHLVYDVYPCIKENAISRTPPSAWRSPHPLHNRVGTPVCVPIYPRTARDAVTHTSSRIQHRKRPSSRVTSAENTLNHGCTTYRTTRTEMGSRNPYSCNALPNLVVPPGLEPREMLQEDIPVLVHLLKNRIRNHYGRNWPPEDMQRAMTGLFQSGSVVQYTVWVDQPSSDPLPRQSQAYAAQPASRQQPGTAAGSCTPKRRPASAALFSAGKVPPHPPGVKHCPQLRPDEIVLTRHILLTQEN